MLYLFQVIRWRQIMCAAEPKVFNADLDLQLNMSVVVTLQVILILTKLYDFNLGGVTESSLWR